MRYINELTNPPTTPSRRAYANNDRWKGYCSASRFNVAIVSLACLSNDWYSSCCC